jgi:O-antigen ligase
MMGRDPTFHGRTGIWSAVLSVNTNPVIGVGYQSFWLGDRLNAVWSRLNVSSLNEAHNGYLETYLNLGLIGLALITLVMVSSYRLLTSKLLTSPQLASLGLALWLVVSVYNVTEAALGPSFLWAVFLLCIVCVPGIREVSTGTTVPLGKGRDERFRSHWNSITKPSRVSRRDNLTSADSQRVVMPRPQRRAWRGRIG